MEEGINALKANYSIVKEINNDAEVEITTAATVQPARAIQLTQLGWIRRADNVFAFIKPRYSEPSIDEIEDIVDETE